MAVLFGVLTTRDVNPEVFVIGGLHDQLVKVAMGFYPVKPLVGKIHVSVLEVIVPIGIGGFGDVDVGSFSEGVLRGVCTTDFDVQSIATITT